jgi:hypothetical protein
MREEILNSNASKELKACVGIRKSHSDKIDPTFFCYLDIYTVLHQFFFELCLPNFSKTNVGILHNKVLPWYRTLGIICQHHFTCCSAGG